MSSDYFLIFNSHFDRDAGLDMGRLTLNTLSGGWKACWKASSSYATKQGAESFHQRGGYIPPQYRVPGLPNWNVATSPLPRPHTKGIEGNLFPITPFSVRTDRGGNRGDFGIHRDANTPGSLGCIVLSDWRFKEFELWMHRLRKEGIGKLSLFVQYS